MCLLGLVLQVLIGAFVRFGFGLAGERPVKDLKVRPRRMLYSPVRN